MSINTLFIIINNRGDNVEQVFLETARKIYQNVQDGRYDAPLGISCFDVFVCIALQRVSAETSLVDSFMHIWYNTVIYAVGYVLMSTDNTWM